MAEGCATLEDAIARFQTKGGLGGATAFIAEYSNGITVTIATKDHPALKEPIPEGVDVKLTAVSSAKAGVR